MAPVNPSGPPPAPMLGQGGFAAPFPPASTTSNGPGNMAAPPPRAPSQASAAGRGGHAALPRGGAGAYARSAPHGPLSNRVPVPFQPQAMYQGFPMGPAGANNNNADDDEDSDSDDEDSTAIRLNIFTPINVRGDGNLIAMDTSATATTIAQGVVDALRCLTYGDDKGVPMIDEDGRPRPIKVNVKAPLTILGSRNLMGERAVMERLAPTVATRPAAVITKVPLTELGGPDEVAKSSENGEVNGSFKKREREGSVEADGDSKRSRVD
ncbi:hypothetical protein ONS95_004766 [Cadophora gregata]|uniref:uncharacterized protein n=1 Tax=Cadophora gregata TaxID=51156 RepID=UPI0026DA7138|nr:uncharacterized protein ONS95_004766 [Cadophora gregata]KAK0104477.1 hypothetical protein ONS95_004766 [Cadophora gregata]KAK0115431.1 hypothetical protein ONS96_013887 [Cadophora gregata f. sp. sojae]